MNDIDGSDFIETRELTESEEHGRKLMNLHNNEAGRRVSCGLIFSATKKAVSDEKDPQLISGAAGVAACIGADFAKVNYPRAWEGMTQPESLGVAVEAAGRCGIICSGGGSLPPEEFLGRLVDQMHVSGCRGAATGRNIHQKGTEDAVRMTAACKAVICDGATLEEALAIYNGQ